MIDELKNIPDVDFVDNITLEDVQNQMVNDYIAKYKEIEGKEPDMSLSNPYRLILYACTLQEFQMYQLINHKGKMDLLKYAVGEFLDNIAALRGISRMPAKPAKTTLRFILNAPLPSTVTIPQGTKVGGNGITFYTSSFAELRPGELAVDVPAECTESGTIGNGYIPGEISQFIDSIPYLDGVSNVTETASGEDIESDEHLADRVYLAPSGYSVAGPTEAYEYFTKACSSAISDVRASSPSPGEVEVRFVLKNGEIPKEEMIQRVSENISGRDKRPLTDHVTVMAPDIVNYDIGLTYYIRDSQKSVAANVKSKIEDAIDRYIQWQDSKIGRDINPSYLTNLIMDAGAKRVEISSPTFTKISDIEIAKLKEKSIVYGGIESD